MEEWIRTYSWVHIFIISLLLNLWAGRNSGLKNSHEQSYCHQNTNIKAANQNNRTKPCNLHTLLFTASSTNSYSTRGNRISYLTKPPTVWFFQAIQSLNVLECTPNQIPSRNEHFHTPITWKITQILIQYKKSKPKQTRDEKKRTFFFFSSSLRRLSSSFFFIFASLLRALSTTENTEMKMLRKHSWKPIHGKKKKKKNPWKCYFLLRASEEESMEMLETPCATSSSTPPPICRIQGF